MAELLFEETKGVVVFGSLIFGFAPSVRRQILWDHLTLFLSDTFLPVTSPV